VWREPFAKLLLTKKIDIDCVICDESHRIKSPGSKCSKFLTKIGKQVPHRYLVTGTPLAENPVDIYAQYRFLDPRIFGARLNDFRDRYENLDIARTTQVGYRILDTKQPYKNLDELHEKMFSCAFKADSSLKLPSQRNIITKFMISPKAEKAYKELTKEGVLEYQAGTLEVENILNLSQRQQQIVSGYVPVLSEDGESRYVNIDKSRCEMLEELLQGLPKDEPVIIFARFRKDLRRALVEIIQNCRVK
jgi:SNF2 family DNA or RNA helicase